MGELVKNDEELARIETEALEETQVTETEAELDTGFELEIVDPSMYGKEKSDELIAAEAKMAELEAAVAAQSAGNTQNEALMETLNSVKALQEQLAGGIKVDAVKPQETAPAIDIEALKTKFNKDIYSDAFTTVVQTVNQMVNPMKAELDSLKAEKAKTDARTEILMTDENRNFYAKYKSEVEDAAKNFSGNDAYTKAMNLVKADHLDEIIAEKVAAAIGETTASKAKPEVPYTNIGKPSAPATPARKQVTPGMQRWMNSMRMKGLADENYLLERATEMKKAGEIVG